MGRRSPQLRKVVDDVVEVRCLSGMGMIREEVWQDNLGEVARYNLAFINHNLYAGDNGRVLGYDNAHGTPERHFKGSVTKMSFPGYEKLLKRFLDEVSEFRKQRI